MLRDQPYNSLCHGVSMTLRLLPAPAQRRQERCRIIPVLETFSDALLQSGDDAADAVVEIGLRRHRPLTVPQGEQWHVERCRHEIRFL